MKIQTSTLVSILFLSFLLLPSCVAKKKFLAMEGSRNRADQRVRELTADVQTLEADFNEYKNDFHFNNSFKDSFIDSLNKTIVSLNSNLLSKSDNIDDQLFSFQVEKRRLNQMLSDKDGEIRKLTRQLNSLEIQLVDLQSTAQDENIKNRNAESKINALQSQLSQKEDELSKLAASIKQKATEIGQLKSSLASEKEEIESLKNQVKLLKSQFGQN